MLKSIKAFVYKVSFLQRVSEIIYAKKYFNQVIAELKFGGFACPLDVGGYIGRCKEMAGDK